MSEVKWIKITTGMFDDEKIRIIESMPDKDSILVIWIKLLVQAGRTNANGYIFLNEQIPYTDEMLATIFNRPLSTVRLALETFQRFGMIHMTEDGIHIANWDKHQNVEGLEKIRQQTRERVQRHREKQKEITGNVTVTLSNATDIEEEEELDIEKKSKKKPNNNDNNDNKKPIQDILDFWNSQEIVKHELTDSMEKEIEKAIKKHGNTQIIAAIKNYATAYKDSKFFYSHKWRLDKFLKQSNALPDFLSDGQQWINYNEQKSKPSTAGLRRGTLEFALNNIDPNTGRPYPDPNFPETWGEN